MKKTINVPSLPDDLVVRAYQKSAVDNVLSAVNSDVFMGYFSVCADGIGFGFGNSYPALDGTQLTEALLWLNQWDVILANWEYVKSFQKENGQLPFAILPDLAGQKIGPEGMKSRVDDNGGLYRHWVAGNPLHTLPYTSYIQSADLIYRFTQDKDWLTNNITSINLAADYLSSLTNDQGFVSGAGYYVERPTRIEYDGVAQCHAADAFVRIGILNEVLGNKEQAQIYQKLAQRITECFNMNFWSSGKYIEYINPIRGKIASHGLTDVDWSAIATGVAPEEKVRQLWPKLRDNDDFYYGGMPTGIASCPQLYEPWESSYPDSMDIASMGRVWYVECWARSRMRDSVGLLRSLHRVCQEGANTGYYWRERYNEQGGYGAHKYCEYPANLIRIVHKFVFGHEFGIDGTLYIGPNVVDAYWDKGFGFRLNLSSGYLLYEMKRNQFTGKYMSKSKLKLAIRLDHTPGFSLHAEINNQTAKCEIQNDWLIIILPLGTGKKISTVQIKYIDACIESCEI